MKHAAVATILAALVPLTLSAPVVAHSSQRAVSRPPAIVAPWSDRTATHGMVGDPYKGFTKTGNAVRQSLLRFAATCGHTATGTGYALFMPGVAGKMHGPHMILQVGLMESRSAAHWGLETIMRQGSAVRDDSSVGDLTVNSHGNGTLTERTMPMIHPGTYMVQLLVHDLSCHAGMQSPVAYKTMPARIVFKGMGMMSSM